MATPGAAQQPSSDNAFDFLRIAAALTVMVSHSHPLAGRPEPQPLHGLTWGLLAVALFFAISGFLVCQSWVRDPSLPRFALRRALRIFPALWVVVLFTALVIGPAFSSLHWTDYFGSDGTWSYIPTAALLLGAPPLPGLFEANPYPLTNNGSLWTLPYEVLMYALLALGGLLLSFRRYGVACALALIGLGAGWLALVGGSTEAPHGDLLEFLGTRPLARALFFGGFFFSGALLFLGFGRYPLSAIAALLLMGASAAASSLFIFPLLLWLAIPYAGVVFAVRAPAVFRKLNGHDYSYGIYIYAFPIQQVVSMAVIRAGYGWSLALPLSVLITAAFAALSWHFIERPALSFKNALLARKPALADPRADLG